jgi:cholesterol transport system auxiliary component
MKSVLVLAGLSLMLGGCVNIGSRDETPVIVYYVLSDPAPAADRHAAPGADAPTLLVLDTMAGSFYDTDQIVFSRSENTRSQYQLARWTERPGKRFARLMRNRLERQGAWHVSDAGSHVRGNLLLDTELVELYHDAASAPGRMRLVLRAELIDLKQHKLLGQRVFEQQIPLATYDAAGAAQASSQAVGRVLDDLAAWLAGTTMNKASPTTRGETP